MWAATHVKITTLSSERNSQTVHTDQRTLFSDFVEILCISIDEQPPVRQYIAEHFEQF